MVDKVELVAEPVEAQAEQQSLAQITGRGAFIIATVSGGIAVGSRLVTDAGAIEIDGKPHDAVFPTLEYALEQIELMRREVVARFAQAANIGTQVIAQAGQSSTAEAQADVLEEALETE